jgi:hypothetical protein
LELLSALGGPRLADATSPHLDRAAFERSDKVLRERRPDVAIVAIARAEGGVEQPLECVEREHRCLVDDQQVRVDRVPRAAAGPAPGRSVE